MCLLYAASLDCQAGKLWYSRNMNTRKATIADSLALSSLSGDVQRLHVQHRPNVFRMPDSDDYAVSFFNEVLADPTVSVFIAEDDERAVGYILCKLVERLENPFTFAARILLVDQISVRPEAHRLGVGTALMQQAERLASELNVQRIVLDSWDFNTKAHEFFEHRGFEKLVFRFWKWVQ